MALLGRLLFKCQTPSESEIAILEEQVVHQSKTLCRDFIFIKLRENGMVDRDIYDTSDPQNINLKSKQGPQCDQIKPGPTDVSKELISIAVVFESRYPNLFADVGNYLKVSYHTSTQQIQSVFKSVAAEIFHGSITWARIVALFIFTASLIVDCIKQGQGRFGDVILIVEALQKFIRKRLAHWIACSGGWSGMMEHFEQCQYPKWQLWVVPGVGLLFGFILAFIS